MLAPPALFNEIYDFEILEFNPILSDVHCPIVFNTPSKIKDSKPLCNAILVQKIKWEGSKNSVFVDNISNEDVETLDNLLLNFDCSKIQILKLNFLLNKPMKFYAKPKKKLSNLKLFDFFKQKRKPGTTRH